MAKRFRMFAEGAGPGFEGACRVRARLRTRWRGRGRARCWPAIKNETLVIAGSGDDLAGAPEPLAACFPNAKAKRIPGCGHMDCLTQPMFKAAVMDFLAGVPD